MLLSLGFTLLCPRLSWTNLFQGLAQDSWRIHPVDPFPAPKWFWRASFSWDTNESFPTDCSPLFSTSKLKAQHKSLESSQHLGIPTELPLQKVNKLLSCTVCTLSSQPFDFHCRTEPSLPCVQYTSEQITHRVNERCWTQVFNFFLARAPEDTAGVVTSTPHTVVLWVSCLAAATISVSHRAVVKSHCKGEKFRGICKHPHRAQQPGVFYGPHSSSCPHDKRQKWSSVFLSFLVRLAQVQKASFEDFSIPFHLICHAFTGKVLPSYHEDLQHCPLEGVVASVQTPQRWIRVEVLCNCTAKTKIIKRTYKRGKNKPSE